jgi:iron complex transport system substrate-binding protein
MRKEILQLFIHAILSAVAYYGMTACNKGHSDRISAPHLHLTSHHQAISPVKHASGFNVEPRENYSLLHFFRYNEETQDTLTYLVKSRGRAVPSPMSDLPVIETPVRNVALLHTTYIAFFEFCESLSNIQAISESEYLYHPETISKVEDGSLPVIGHSENLNKEQLIALDPELVITVGFPNTPNKNKELLESLGYPVLVLAEWQESTLLGRMEWVKIFGLLLGKDSLVNAKFNAVEQQYVELKDLALDADHRPQVISNAPYKESWWVPAGDSYASNLIHDAGGDYLWRKIPGTGGIPLDFETVFAEGHQADYWINPGTARRKEELRQKDERLLEFRAVDADKTYHSFKRANQRGGNDYWESGLVNPHLVLADLIRIFHPELLPEHELFFYEKLSNQ